MICETFDIKNENSQEYARLNTYLIILILLKRRHAR